MALVFLFSSIADAFTCISGYCLSAVGWSQRGSSGEEEVVAEKKGHVFRFSIRLCSRLSSGEKPFPVCQLRMKPVRGRRGQRGGTSPRAPARTAMEPRTSCCAARGDFCAPGCHPCCLRSFASAAAGGISQQRSSCVNIGPAENSGLAPNRTRGNPHVCISVGKTRQLPVPAPQAELQAEITERNSGSRTLPTARPKKMFAWLSGNNLPNSTQGKCTACQTLKIIN